MRYLRRFFFIPILLIVFLVIVYSVYDEVRNKTIEQFNAEQILIAKAASQGITDYINNYQSELKYLSGFPDIIDFNHNGKILLTNYYKNRLSEIEAITRVDSKGIILDTYPENKNAIGQNISNQKHVEEVIKTRKIVISDVFMAVQGYLAIAIHVPLFKGDEFKGSLAILIQIDKIGNRYLKSIKRGESGYAFLLSEKNIEIYCPYPEHIGTSILDVSHNHPSLIKLIEQIKKEDFGSLNCTHDISETMDNGEKHVVYYRIPLGNTYWTILISIPKAEVYKTIAGFQNRLILLFSVLIIIILVYFYFFTKARTVLKEEAKRKIAEKALIKSEEKYRLISGVASDYMFTSMLNNEGKIQLNWVAGAFEIITGYSLDEYIAIGGWRNTLHPDDLEKDDLDMEHLHENQKVITEVRTYHKNGTILWVRVYANPIWNDKDNKLTGIYGAVQDITERKKAEENLIESESYNRTLFNQSPIGLALANMEGQLIDVNSSFAEIIGRTIEETLTLSYWDITPKEYAEQEQKQLDSLKTTGHYGPYEKEYIHKDGHSVPVRLQGLIIERKGVPHIWSSVEDITESKLAEKNLKESKFFFEQLFVQSSTSTQLLDPEGWCVKINPKLSELFGVKPEHIEGKKYNILKDDEIIRTGVIDHLKRVFEFKETVFWEVNFDIQHASESTGVPVTKTEKKWFQNIAYPILNAEGDLMYVIIQHEDISRRKQSEIEIKTLNEELEQRIIERTKDLELKISEIERMNKLFIDRELRMIQLKETIKEFKAKEKRNSNN